MMMIIATETMLLKLLRKQETQEQAKAATSLALREYEEGHVEGALEQIQRAAARGRDYSVYLPLMKTLPQEIGGLKDSRAA
jgi:hypothetical protein